MRLRIRVARPMARGRKRLSVGPSSACTAAIRSSSPTSSWLCSALATADSSSLSHGLAAAARREGQDGPRLGDVLAADVVAHQPRLAGGGAHVACARALHRARRAARRAAAVALAAGASSAAFLVGLSAPAAAARPRPRARCPRRSALGASAAGALRLGLGGLGGVLVDAGLGGGLALGLRLGLLRAACASASASGCGGLPRRRRLGGLGLLGAFGLVGVAFCGFSGCRAHRTRPFESCPR